MADIIQFLIEWGYLGMFLSAIISGSVLPFSSEVVLAALIHPSTHLNPWLCVFIASIGNTLGGMTCYLIGRLGRLDWLEKYFHLKKSKIEKMQTYLNKRSAFIAFFSFLPILGDVIPATLGLMRSNVYKVCISMFLGKFIRYIIVAYAIIEAYSII
jgi:membrane protein YqaA with SNARE-associated domain